MDVIKLIATEVNIPGIVIIVAISLTIGNLIKKGERFYMTEGLEKGFKELTYASLGETEEKKMRELEREFNNEFGTEYYFMIMKQGK